MNKIFLKKIKQTLLEQRAELSGKMMPDRDVDTDGDEMDNIQGNLIIEMNTHFSTRIVDRLAKIADALKAIKEDTYGICQDCEEEIPEKRLIYDPCFETCVSCAEDREFGAKQRKI